MIDAGFDLTYDQIRSHIDRIYQEKGIEYQRVFDQLLQDVLGRVDYKILAAGIIGYRRAREAALKPYPHVTATLNALVKMNIKLGLVSDAPAREAWLRLCFINFHHIFDVVVTYDDTGERKPSPKPFLKALEQLQVEPHHALMVGDWAERDILGAKNVGMRTAFAQYGDPFGTTNHQADYVLTDISQLLDILRSKATPVTEIDDQLIQLIRSMFATLYNAPGIGLAANQVGETVAVTVIDISDLEEGKGTGVMQHEIDHLNGIYFFDHLSPVQRARIFYQLRQIRKGLVKTSYPIVKPSKAYAS